MNVKPHLPQLFRRTVRLTTAFLLCGALVGCAAVTNPVADAVPVNRLPPEVKGRAKSDEKTIPMTLLRQKPPAVYLLGPGDVLGVYIETVLGEKNQPLPVHIAERGNTPPSLGYPLPVREDGTLPLPLLKEPVKVTGLSVDEAQRKIIEAYTVTQKILKPDNARVIVTLQKPRTYHILVVRQDSGGLTVGGGGSGESGGGGSTSGGAAGVLGQTKRGTGYTIDLPAYENDVLNALARTGGLPGLDAQNEVRIERGSFKPGVESDAEAMCRLSASGERTFPGVRTLRIPLRLRPDEEVPFRPEDVILQSGDTLFIEARDTELFYTGGLLPARQFVLPRDYDLDVVQAIALANGPLVNGGLNQNNLTGQSIQAGIGFPSPSLVTVLRRTADGGQIPIRVSLNKALRDPREQVLIQAGDTIILQETVGEALGQYFTQVVRINFFGTFIRSRDLTATSNVTLP